MSRVNKVTRKEKKTSYEAGSGTLYIPIISDLFPKLFKQNMRSTHKFYIISDNTKYQVKEDVYNKLKEGDYFNKNLSLFA